MPNITTEIKKCWQKKSLKNISHQKYTSINKLGRGILKQKSWIKKFGRVIGNKKVYLHNILTYLIIKQPIRERTPNRSKVRQYISGSELVTWDTMIETYTLDPDSSLNRNNTCWSYLSHLMRRHWLRAGTTSETLARHAANVSPGDSCVKPDFPSVIPLHDPPSGSWSIKRSSLSRMPSRSDAHWSSGSIESHYSQEVCESHGYSPCKTHS